MLSNGMPVARDPKRAHQMRKSLVPGVRDCNAAADARWSPVPRDAVSRPRRPLLRRGGSNRPAVETSTNSRIAASLVVAANEGINASRTRKFFIGMSPNERNWVSPQAFIHPPWEDRRSCIFSLYR